MLRKSILVVVLIAFLLATVPYLMGLYSKSQMEDGIEELQSSFKHYNMVRFDVLEHELGWNTSNLKLQVTLTGDLAEPFISLSKSGDKKQGLPWKFRDGKVRFTLNNQIKHGPIIKDNGKWIFAQSVTNGHLDIGERDRKTLINLVGTDDIFNIHALVHLDGSIDFSIESPELRLTKEPDKELWKGLSLKTRVASDHDNAKVHFSLPYGEFSSDQIGSSLILHDILYQGTLTRSVYDMWVGQGNLSLGGIKILETEETPGFSLNDVTINANTAVHEGLMQQNATFRMGKLLIDGTQYGPLHFNFGLKNFAVDPMLEMKEKTEEMNRPGFHGNPMAHMEYLLPELLKSNPQIEINGFFLRTPMGDINSEFFIEWDYPENENTLDPMLALAYMKVYWGLGTSEILLNEALLLYWQDVNAYNPHATRLTEFEKKGHMDEFVEFAKKYLLEQKWLVKDKDAFKFDFELKNEQLVLNGAVIEPQAANELGYRLAKAATVPPKDKPAPSEGAGASTPSGNTPAPKPFDGSNQKPSGPPPPTPFNPGPPPQN